MTEWNFSTEEFEGVLQKELKELCYYKARDVYLGCIRLSPVYTGRYRASWRISVGHADESYVAAEDAGTPDNPLSAPKMPVHIRPILLPKFPVIYVSNNVPYAELIENGWSKQAPYGVMRVVLEEQGEA